MKVINKIESVIDSVSYAMLTSMLAIPLSIGASLVVAFPVMYIIGVSNLPKDVQMMAEIIVFGSGALFNVSCVLFNKYNELVDFWS